MTFHKRSKIKDVDIIITATLSSINFLNDLIIFPKKLVKMYTIMILFEWKLFFVMVVKNRRG